MATDALTLAFEVGRDQYIVDALAYRGWLDQAAATFRLQVADAGSQTWVDWLTVDHVGAVTIPNTTIVVGSVAWANVTGTPTTLAGYGITDPVVLTSGSYADPTWIPSLSAAKLTGTLQAAQFPALTGDVTTVAGALATTLATVNANVGTFGSATQVAQVTVNAKGLVTAVANVTVTPAASSITGVLGLAHGGTAADLSATGGASQVLRQSSVGAAVTVGQLSISDISGGVSGSGTTGKIPKWSSSSALTDSIMAVSGSTVTVTGSSLNGTAMLLTNGDFYSVKKSDGTTLRIAGITTTDIVYLGGIDGLATVIRSAGTDAITIDTSQRVGIGTTSPTAVFNSVIAYSSGSLVVAGKFSTVGGYHDGDTGVAIDFGSDQDTYSTWVTGRIGSIYHSNGTAWGGDVIIYTNSGSTQNSLGEAMRWNALGDTIIPATHKLYLDGGGDTYLQENAANSLILVAGGSTVAQALSTQFAISSNAHFSVEPTKKVFLDGGGDTYLIESSANVFNIFTAGNKTWGVNAAGDLTYNGNIVLSSGTPTIASGFKSGSIAGADSRFVVTIGAALGSINGTVNFGHTFTNVPVVTLTTYDNAAGSTLMAYVSAVSTTSVSINFAGSIAGTTQQVMVHVTGY